MGEALLAGLIRVIQSLPVLRPKHIPQIQTEELPLELCLAKTYATPQSVICRSV